MKPSVVASNARNLAKQYKSVLDLVQVVEEIGSLENHIVSLKKSVIECQKVYDAEKEKLSHLTSERDKLTNVLKNIEDNIKVKTSASNKIADKIKMEAKQAADQYEREAEIRVKEEKKKLLFLKQAAEKEMNDMVKRRDEAADEYKRLQTSIANLLNDLKGKSE